jgi:hypothetical protein
VVQRMHGCAYSQDFALCVFKRQTADMFKWLAACALMQMIGRWNMAMTTCLRHVQKYFLTSLFCQSFVTLDNMFETYTARGAGQ